MTSLQSAIEKARAEYEGKPPLLARLAQAHGITVREFSAIFGVAKSTAQEVLHHQKFPIAGVGCTDSAVFRGDG